MSGNTSATGGYIRSIGTPPPTAEEIQQALQTMVSALTGLAGPLVRPRWQPMPPVQPDLGITWAAIGVTLVEADQYPTLIHHDGYSVMQRHSTVTVVTTFYGPEAEDVAAELRDSLYLAQNFEALLALGIKLKTVHDLARAPEFINNQWLNRIDLRIEYRMQTDRVYPILNLDGADATIVKDNGAADDLIQVRPLP